MFRLSPCRRGIKNLTPEKALAAAEKIGATMVLAKPLALDSVVTAVKKVLGDE
ncbi:MAG: hypothetical protein O3B76_08665 [Proteobacteria bacterium]|nr:hypothetical protein [Pseudomonadota bacterium]MDA1022310.1 hypothetical protein [Pseudomonadota bacterium]